MSYSVSSNYSRAAVRGFVIRVYTPLWSIINITCTVPYEKEGLTEETMRLIEQIVLGRSNAGDGEDEVSVAEAPRAWGRHARPFSHDFSYEPANEISDPNRPFFF